MELFFDQQLQDHMLSREVPEDEAKDRYQSYRAARRTLGRVIAREVWLLAPVVREEMSRFNKALSVRADNWFDEMDSGAGAVIDAQKAIASLAAADLHRPRLISIGSKSAPDFP